MKNSFLGASGKPACSTPWKLEDGDNTFPVDLNLVRERGKIGYSLHPRRSPAGSWLDREILKTQEQIIGGILRGSRIRVGRSSSVH